LGGGRRLRPAIGDIDGRKIEMPAFYRRHEAALATQLVSGRLSIQISDIENQPAETRRRIRSLRRETHEISLTLGNVATSVSTGNL
jgi:hypothetical protein